ncbi:MAG: transcription antitermination factor NusB [Propionibacteriaceae bacterium]|nr:transcription antitermination factor NusB [Propionibacteriaceae bacterium]
MGTAKRGSARHKARKRAVDILYAADLLGRSIDEELLHQSDPVFTAGIRDFTELLVSGVAENIDQIDASLEKALADSGWSLPRMPTLDRAIARLAAYEISLSDIENAVAISEAVLLADELSSGASSAFLNGVLGKLSRSEV